MEIEFGSKFNRKLIKIYRKNRSIGDKIDQKINILATNPGAGVLRLHKLSGGKRGYWSISIEADLRIIFCFSKIGILLADIGSHDEVY